jgi:uncharacterized protein
VLSDELILPWLERLRQEVPELHYFDAHTHIGGNDPDGFSCTRERLIDSLELLDARAVVFAMHEPDGYPAANDRIIAEAKASDGRLVPFCRLDPEADPVDEAERALAAGAQGIKFHPRAENFTFDHPAVADVFALANERSLPIICHAGRGIPALGRDAAELCERFPDARLILAHAGICDLAWIWRAAADLPNLLFDTAWWSAADLLALFTLVPPGQIVLGSDAPYGTPALAATLDTRYALQAGLDHDQVRSVMGGQLERLLAREELLDLGPALGPESLSRDPLLERVYTFLIYSIGQLFNGLEARESLDLARLACEVGDDTPQAPVCRSILALIEEQRTYSAEDPGRPARMSRGLHLIVLASALALTPGVPLPHEPVPVDVAERTPS